MFQISFYKNTSKTDTSATIVGNLKEIYNPKGGMVLNSKLFLEVLFY